MKKLRIIDLGVMDYASALGIMQDVHRDVAHGVDDTILFVEHTPVITIGKDGGDRSVVDEGHVRNIRVPVVHVDRGGGAVVHNNGQLVGYPVMKLADMPLDLIEEIVDTMADVAAEFSIKTHRGAEPGLWASGGKIGFVGMKVHRNISTHGFAINVSNDLDLFQTIETCGVRHERVSNLTLLTRQLISMDSVKQICISKFARRFGYIPDQFIMKEGSAAV